MALVKCKECGKDVSSTATACPHCGAPVKTGNPVVKAASGIWTALKLFVGFVVLLVVYQCTQRMSTLDERVGAAPAVNTLTATPTAAPAPPPAPPGWKYETRTDQMTSKVLPLAGIRSVNSMNLEFPYKGPNYGSLLVKRSAKGETDVMFSIDKGQTMCRSYKYSCEVNVRFDDGQPVTFRGIGPSDSSTEHAFLENPAKFIAAATKAKRIRVSMDIYQAGTQVLDFTPSEPLQWPPKGL